MEPFRRARPDYHARMRAFPPLFVVLLASLQSCATTADGPPRPRPLHWAQPMVGSSIDNWHRVDDVLYRCGQPDGAGMRELAAHGVRTIVNLRSWHSDRDEVAGTGLTLVEVPLGAGSLTYPELVATLRALLAAEKPVIVHCWQGADRTGAVVAAYRIAVHRWTPEAALDEMVGGGFGHASIYGNLRELIASLDPVRLRTDVGLAP